MQAYIEKEDSKKLKQKQRERMQPKMGKMDIDYQVWGILWCLLCISMLLLVIKGLVLVFDIGFSAPFQVLHDAFFKYQTKPKLTSYGDLYYEGKEFEVRIFFSLFMSIEIDADLVMPSLFMCFTPLLFRSN